DSPRNRRVVSRRSTARRLVRRELDSLPDRPTTVVGIRPHTSREPSTAVYPTLVAHRPRGRGVPDRADRRRQGRSPRPSPAILHVAHRSAVVPPGAVRGSTPPPHWGRRGPGSGQSERIWRKASAVPSDLPVHPRSHRSPHLDLGGDRLDGVPDRALAETIWSGIRQLDGRAALRAGTLSAALHQWRDNRLRSPRSGGSPGVCVLPADPLLRPG